MMINKRLIDAVPESKKYIAGNVALQWCSLCANIAMMSAVTALLAALYAGSMTQSKIVTTAVIALAAVAVRYGCTVGASRMGYLSSKAVKKTLRGAIYDKLLCLGASYSEQVKTSEVVQVAVEGVDQLETYFGAYLPQFFYAMLAPLTLFVVLCFVSVPAAVVLLVCVPLIPVAIAAVQTWAKKLLSKYWGQYTALGDTFLENLQGLTTLKIYQADAFKNDEMNVEAEKFRKITMKVLTMQLNSITIMDLIAYGGAALGVGHISDAPENLEQSPVQTGDLLCRPGTALRSAEGEQAVGGDHHVGQRLPQLPGGQRHGAKLAVVRFLFQQEYINVVHPCDRRAAAVGGQGQRQIQTPAGERGVFIFLREKIADKVRIENGIGLAVRLLFSSAVLQQLTGGVKHLHGKVAVALPAVEIKLFALLPLYA